MFALSAAVAFSMLGWATTLDETFQRRLLGAREASSVVVARGEYEHIKILRLACRHQIASRVPPVTCYEELNWEEKWGTRSAHDRRRLERGLDARCARAARALILPSASVNLDKVSRACRDRIREGLRIKAYRDEAKGWYQN